MSIRPYVLREANWQSVQQTEYEVAVLPWGATAAHNFHLPYATDNFQAEAIAEAAAGLAWEQDRKVIVLPAIPFGVNTQQMDIPLTINMSPSTQAQVLADVVESLEDFTIRKLVVLNGHGGNDFRQMIRELQTQTELFLCSVNWYAISECHDMFDDPGDHAGEMETSLMMHLHPDLVLPLDQAGDGHARQSKIDGFKKQWAWAPRAWTQVTDDTGVGNPKTATAEKGRAFFDAVTQEMARFLIDLADADPDDLYV